MSVYKSRTNSGVMITDYRCYFVFSINVERNASYSKRRFTQGKELMLNRFILNLQIILPREFQKKDFIQHFFQKDFKI